VRKEMSEKLPKKRQYRIPCSWESYGVMYVEAKSLEQAKDLAENWEPLPDSEYVDGSFKIDEDILELYLEEDGLLEPPYEGWGRSDEEVIE
jgi:hypothetical protein